MTDTVKLYTKEDLADPDFVGAFFDRRTTRKGQELALRRLLTTARDATERLETMRSLARMGRDSVPDVKEGIYEGIIDSLLDGAARVVGTQTCPTCGRVEFGVCSNPWHFGKGDNPCSPACRAIWAIARRLRRSPTGRPHDSTEKP